MNRGVKVGCAATAARGLVPIVVTLGFHLVELAEGHAVFEAEAGPWAYNPIGSVHGS